MDDFEELPEEIVQQHIDGLVYHIEQGLFSRKHLEFLNKKAIAKLNEVLDDGTPKEYLNLTEGSIAYSQVLDKEATALEALQYVADYFGKDDEWVKEIKDKSYFHAREVVELHNDHPVQKAMVKDGSMRKKALTKAPTPNYQLRELHSQRKLHSTLNSLKAKTKELSDKVEDLSVQTVISDTHLDKVMEILGVEELTNKEKASKLKANKITQKKISEYLDIPLRTVKRWWPTL